MTVMTARMTNPAFVVDGALEALHGVSKTLSRASVPEPRELVHLRVAQINGCAVCIDLHARGARRAGESEERIHTVAAWRESPFFSDAERAALGLAEALTRVADASDPVPDAAWEAAAEQFDEAQLGALVLDVAMANVWNRLNVGTRQVVGEQSW